MADKVTITEGCELGYHVYHENGWYGKRYFYYTKTDIESKTRANSKYKSMVGKFIKRYALGVDQLGEYECLKEGDTQTTYIHCTGPSYSLTRIELNSDKLERFTKIENARLKHNRENSYNRVNHDEYVEYYTW